MPEKAKIGVAGVLSVGNRKTEKGRHDKYEYNIEYDYCY